MLKLNVMKQRFTTPAFKLSASRFVLVAAVVVMAISTPISMMQQTVGAESIAQLNAKIDALEHQKRQYQASAGRLGAKADTLANKVAKLQNKQDKVQAQIDLSQAQYDKLKKQIEVTKQRIQNNQDALGNTLASMYVDSSISPLEMLASSNNIGDYVDKQAYRSSVNDQLTETISQINTLKKDLEDQQRDVKVALNEQKNAENELAATKVEQQNILNETRGQEGTYKKLAKKTEVARQKIADEISRKQLEVINSGQGTVISTGGGNGYPYHCYVNGAGYSAGEDGRGYGCSQCVSYAAWMMSKYTHGKLYPTGWGNADMFTGNASAEGYNVSYVPRKNSIVFFPAGVNGAPLYNYDGSRGVGHVAWVEGTSEDKSTIIVSQYNYNTGSGMGKWSRMSFPNYGGMQYIYP